jgi:hypothetical protein
MTTPIRKIFGSKDQQASPPEDRAEDTVKPPTGTFTRRGFRAKVLAHVAVPPLDDLSDVPKDDMGLIGSQQASKPHPEARFIRTVGEERDSAD